MAPGMVHPCEGYTISPNLKGGPEMNVVAVLATPFEPAVCAQLLFLV